MTRLYQFLISAAAALAITAPCTLTPTVVPFSLLAGTNAAGSWQQLLNSAPIIVVKFYKNACGPCGTAKPVFERISNQFPGVKFVEINGEQYPQLMQQAGINRFPGFVYIKNGAIVDRTIGLKESEIRQKIAQLVD